MTLRRLWWHFHVQKGSNMNQLKAREILSAVFGRDDDAAVLSRRNVLAGLGLVGAVLAAPQLLSATAAEAKPLAKPEPDAAATEVNARAEQASQEIGTEASEATDLSSQYWRRRRRRYVYWRRPRRYIVVRRRYWRRRRYW